MTENAERALRVVEDDDKEKFCNGDLLKREKALLFLLDRIKHSEDEGNNTIALKGDFGTGKTYFLNMFKERLERQEIKHVYFDAWESEKIANPLISFTSLLTNNVLKSKRTKIKNRVKKIGDFIKPIANKAAFVGVELETGGSTGGVAGVAASKTTDKLIDAIFCGEVKKSIDDYRKVLSGALDKKVVVLVDELDRCKPDYAIEVFETIKHFFKNDSNKEKQYEGLDNLVFVIAMNSTSLKEAVASVYSSEVANMDYVSKFIDFEMNLPNISGKEQFILKCADGDIEKIIVDIEKDEKKYFLLSNEETFYSYLNLFSKRFELNLRQINKIINYYKIIHNRNKFNSFIFSYLLCLKEYSNEIYYSLIYEVQKTNDIDKILHYMRENKILFFSRIDNHFIGFFQKDESVISKLAVNIFDELKRIAGLYSIDLDTKKPSIQTGGYYEIRASFKYTKKVYDAIENISEFMG